MPDILHYSLRAPRQRAEASHEVPLAFVDIPLPDPDLAVAIVDVASGTLEDARSRAVEIVYEAALPGIAVNRNGDTAQQFLLTQPSSLLGTLQGMRLSIPCNTLGNCTDPAPVTSSIVGQMGQSYQVTLRIRGVVETRLYPGSTYNDGNYWSSGVDSETTDTHNIYKLTVSDPPQVYYLNTAQASHPEANAVHALDYTKTLTVNANAIVTLLARTLDNTESQDSTVQVSGLSYSTGQFLNIDVTSVSALNTLPATALPFLSQETISVPIRVLRIKEDSAGTWTPIVSRGTFYRVWRMNASEGSGSWLRTAGFTEGQYLLLAYSTEFDWRLQSGTEGWTGTGFSGGGGIWDTQKLTSFNVSSRTLSLTATGAPGVSTTPRILALGGIKTDNGLELLAEQPRFINGVLQPCGHASTTNQTQHTYVECFPATGQTITAGRTRTDRPLGTALIADWDTQTYTVAELLTAMGISADPSAIVFRFSGAFYVQTEGFFLLKTTYHGKLRLFHWGLPVVDQWYGQPTDGINSSNYSPYLHVGWHDYVLEWSPDHTADSMQILHANESLWWSSGLTASSQVQSIDTQTGQVTLRQDYVAGGSSNSSPSLIASYAMESIGVNLRGYFNDAGSYVGLDLNPAAGRFCSKDTGGSTVSSIATKDWALHSSCWLYAIPTMACALTDSAGAPYQTAIRTWQSAYTLGIIGSLRWGRVSNQEALQPGISGQSPLASSSSFGGAILGQSVYSSSSQSTGVSPEHDPRINYASAVIFAHLNVVAGTPSLDSIKIYDVRSRGGGLSHETSPTSLPTGGPRERTETNWDIAPWDGYDGSVTGTALYEVPQEILDGSDGCPIFSVEEIEGLIKATVPLGVRPVIVYTE